MMNGEDVCVEMEKVLSDFRIHKASDKMFSTMIYLIESSRWFLSM